jgi:hypothetical protein
MNLLIVTKRDTGSVEHLLSDLRKGTFIIRPAYPPQTAKTDILSVFRKFPQIVGGRRVPIQAVLWLEWGSPIARRIPLWFAEQQNVTK